MAYKRIRDADIVALNAAGLSLKGIGKRLRCHPTTVTHRLKALGIPPADTRRSFMQELVDRLPKGQRTWLLSKVGPALPAEAFLADLIGREYLRSLESPSQKREEP